MYNLTILIVIINGLFFFAYGKQFYLKTNSQLTEYELNFSMITDIKAF